MVLCLSRSEGRNGEYINYSKDRPVTFKLQAMDTMTSFWIPGWVVKNMP